LFNGLRQPLLRNRYVKDKTITQLTKKAGDSHFWMVLMGVNDQFIKLGKFKLRDGSQIRFWEDILLGRHHLKAQYPNLYNIVPLNVSLEGLSMKQVDRVAPSSS